MSSAIVGNATLVIEPTRTDMLTAIATAVIAFQRVAGGSPSPASRNSISPIRHRVKRATCPGNRPAWKLRSRHSVADASGGCLSTGRLVARYGRPLVSRWFVHRGVPQYPAATGAEHADRRGGAGPDGGQHRSEADAGRAHDCRVGRQYFRGR